MSLKRALPREKFLSLQRQLQRSGELYEDRGFPPNFRSLFTKTRPSVNLQWKRPKDICTNPKFFTKGVSRTDIAQGRMLNCWFVAAVASLTDAKELFDAVCPADQSFDEPTYCGMFRFNFWRFGEWVEVIIDDFLPTHNGKLYYARSSDPEEFWSALLEKAYAKVCGSYEAMGLGRISEALQDFTGGVIEMINLQAPPADGSLDVYKVLQKAHERNSLMGASIETGAQTIQRTLPNGLISGHAYSITGFAKVNLPTLRGLKLIRLRNPHGNSSEWKGAWSDRSEEWYQLSSEERKRLNLVFDDDGEFWMTMEDFQANFTRIEICMLTPDSVLEEDEKKSWKIRREKGRWQADATAGGCRNFIDTFHINPQIRVQLQDPDEDDDEDCCSIVVSLMRIDRKRTPANERPPIGFAIYKVPEDLRDTKERFDRRFFETTKATAITNSFTKLREISCRYSLPPGEYVLVPSTFHPRQEAEFLLRIFSEKPHEAREIDVETKIATVPKPLVSSEEALDIDKQFWKTFQKFSGEDGEIDQYELQEILSLAFANLVNSNSFSLEACRSMIAMFDIDKTGALGYKEFRALWMILRQWKEVFHRFDKDQSGDMNLFELRDALTALGYRLSNTALSSIHLRYHNKKGTIPFDIFIQILVRVIVMFDTFRSHVMKRGPRASKAVFTIDDFIESALTV